MKARYFLFFVVILPLLRALPVRACTAPPGYLSGIVIADFAAAAPAIFRGTVMSEDIEYTTSTVTIRVARYFKGAGNSEVIVDGFGPSAACLQSVNTGDDLIFFATPVSGEPGHFTAFYMSQRATAPSTSENIINLETALGLDPVTPQAPISPAVDPTPGFAEQPGAPLALVLLFVLGCVVLLVLGASAVGTLILLRRRG